MLNKFVRGLAIATLAAGTIAMTASAATIQENRTATMKSIWANFKPITLVAKGPASPRLLLLGLRKPLE